MLENLWTVGMATEDGPRLSAHSALRAFALHPAWRTPAITPDVPFCAAARVATAVVLARRSEVGRRREIADSKCADIRRHSRSLWSPGASFERRSPSGDLAGRESCMRPERHFGDSQGVGIKAPA